MYGKYSEMYSQWCAYYDSEEIELKTIRKYIDYHNKDIVDIGCGTGRFLFRVLPHIKSAIGIDIDDYSIDVLNKLLLKKHHDYAHKVKISNTSVAEIQLPSDSIDLAFFTWSLYALSKDQMQQAMRNLFQALRSDGYLVVLQPTGGQFEKVMRSFFEEHEDADEYTECLENMKETTSRYFNLLYTDKIISFFRVPGLENFCDMLKMFAVTEGGCSSYDALQDVITVPKLLERNPECISENDIICLQDEVTLFIFNKKGCDSKE